MFNAFNIKLNFPIEKHLRGKSFKIRMIGKTCYFVGGMMRHRNVLNIVK